MGKEVQLYISGFLHNKRTIFTQGSQRAGRPFICAVRVLFVTFQSKMRLGQKCVDTARLVLIDSQRGRVHGGPRGLVRKHKFASGTSGRHTCQLGCVRDVDISGSSPPRDFIFVHHHTGHLVRQGKGYSVGLLLIGQGEPFRYVFPQVVFRCCVIAIQLRRFREEGRCCGVR